MEADDIDEEEMYGYDYFDNNACENGCCPCCGCICDGIEEPEE